MLRSAILKIRVRPRFHSFFPLQRSLTTKSGDGKKENFDTTVLQPAQRGELTKHASGIPRLAGRRSKVRLTPPPGRGAKPPVSFQEEDDEWESDAAATLGGPPGRKSLAESLSRSRRTDQRSGGSKKGAVDLLEDFDFKDDYYAPGLIDDDKYYWREEEFDILPSATKAGKLSLEGNEDDEDYAFEIPYGKEDLEGTKNFFLTVDKDGDDDDDDDDIDFLSSLEQGDDDDDIDDIKLTEEEEAWLNENMLPHRDEEDVAEQGGRKEPWQFVDPEEHFFFGQHDIATIAGLPEDAFENDEHRLEKVVLPLRDHGDDLEDFLESVLEHPSRYARATHINLHPHSQREPKPDSARNRSQPPTEFVEAHARFLFVSGLPQLEVNGQVGDLENPVHRSFLQKSIAALVGVDSTRVFPANTTSGFVGFASPKELADAIARGPSERSISSPPDITMPVGPDADNEFVKNSPAGTVVRLANMPTGNTSASLVRDLFPVDTEVGAVYGEGLSPGDFSFLSSSRVLVRFSSKEQAESSLSSKMIIDRFDEIGRYPVSYFRARRELVHAGFGGPTRSKEVRGFGPRLIVDSDMPSKTFFLSHGGVIHLRNLDPTLTKEQISEIFQPYSAQRRDVQGSIEFVRCEMNNFTGSAYVGFDIPGEAEAAIEQEGGRVTLGDQSAIMRMVHDRQIPNRPLARPEKRPDRTAEELLQDLNNWEQYVDAADIAELEKAGVSKIVLDEALRPFRFHNPTFGALDSSLRSEAIRPETGFGDNYKGLVQMYVQTLKECLPTTEDVGDIYKALHFPDEPVDLSIFDREKERQKMLHEKRANP
jgi:hypothetical protein